jgi:hypothetical protein
LTENVAEDEVEPAFRLAVNARLPEVRVTLPVGAFPEAACKVTVTVAVAVCATVDRFVVTVIVVADVTFTVVAADADALTTGLTVVSPLYLAVMELLPQVSALADTVRLALAALPEAITVCVPSAAVPL